MEGIVLTSAYVGNCQIYSKLASHPTILLEQHCHYAKQTYRNRCNIATANGVMSLSIPTVKPQTEKCKTKDIRIDNSQNWQQIHWRALESGYNSSPFFDYYRDDLFPFYDKQFDYLLDYNSAIQDVVLELLDIECTVQLTEEYNSYADSVDYRDKISAKKQLEDIHFSPQPYYQVFAHKFGFLPNLSILDLLFNMGNESILTLQKSYIP
ncbi:MAG: WbqC family protein [Paludibacteraceae bacterium]|nr:WbqC family protein [Paludibacteraceae bacterium]